MSGLSKFFNPQSIAVLGASDDPLRIGGRPIGYMLRSGFSGQIVPINPKRQTVQGLQAFPDLKSVPINIDLLLVSLPASSVVEGLDGLKDAGVKAAILFSAGFSEVGNREAEQQIKMLVEEAGVRMLGPNCLGVYNSANGLAATFASFLLDDLPMPGRIGMVSQSGAFGSYLFTLARSRGVKFAQWATTGNEADVSAADIVSHFAQDPEVEIIACALEGVADGKTLVEALASATCAGKPVVIFKSGRTTSGAAVAKSHTGSLIVDDSVFEHAVQSVGALRVKTTEEMLDTLTMLQAYPRQGGANLGVVSMSGGAGVIIADAAAEAGLHLPSLGPESQSHLRQANPFGTWNNPIDMTAQALNDQSIIKVSFEALFGDPKFEAIIVVLMNWLSAPNGNSGVLRSILECIPDELDRPVIVVGSCTLEAASALMARGCVIFEDPSRAVAALRNLAQLRPGQFSREEPAPTRAKTLLRGDESHEVSAKNALKQAGLPFLNETFVPDVADIGMAVRSVGTPVAIKVVSQDLPHKSEVGGVYLNIANELDAEEIARRMAGRIEQKMPNAKLEGFLVSPMVSDGVELILAAKSDPTFGIVTLLGFGGIFVELLRSKIIRIGRLTEGQACSMIDELPGRELLEGVRGRPEMDRHALVDAIMKFSDFAASNEGRFETIELNPLIVRPKSLGCVALDALITFPSAK